MPRYFASLACGIAILLILTGGHRCFFKVNVVCVEFDSLTFIRHNFIHILIESKFLLINSEAEYGSLCIAIMTVSSAYVAVYLFEFSGKSAVNIVYRTGPRILS